jgi:hypothetical protein
MAQNATVGERMRRKPLVITHDEVAISSQIVSGTTMVAS